MTALPSMLDWAPGTARGILTDLLDAATDALNRWSVGAPARAMVAIAATPDDQADQLTVWAERARTDNPPGVRTVNRPHVAVLVVRMHLVRPWPVIDTHGYAPEPEAITDASLGLADDLEVLMHVAECFLRAEGQSPESAYRWSDGRRRATLLSDCVPVGRGNGRGWEISLIVPFM